jgi:glycosyltransferase involved in cell wall biosynthesis
MEKDSYDEVRNHMYSEHEPILVSVAMIAYNVEKYIEEAIESVLNQRTKFRVQLVIGEDCSTDSTREMVISYQSKYPKLIKALLHEKNKGLTPNCAATINACDGKYVALLDSDDYWTSTDKLEKQINFLESNLLYSGSGHQSMKIYDDKSAEESLFGAEKDCDYEILDTITHRKFHTSSLVFRKDIWDQVGGIPTNISSNERAIYPMVAIFGKIKYFKESMCVYRFTGYGLSSKITFKELETDLNMLSWLNSFAPNFPVYRFRSFLHLCIFTYPTKRIPLSSLIKNYLLFLIFSFSYFPSNLPDLKWGTIDFIRRLTK